MVVTTVDLNTTTGSPHRLLSDLSLAVAKSKKIVVVTGAGISCSSGIPDFRSSDGLYNLVKSRYPNTFLKGKDLFDASLFRDSASTSVFYTFISQLKRSVDGAKPTATHEFIKTLDTKNKLLRSYTQNIDGLEADAGLLCSSSEEARAKGKLRAKEIKNVQLHGDLRRVRCITCSASYPCTAEHLDTFNEGEAPDCPDCSERSEARVARSARRLRVGSLRPAIVLYDEPHPLGDDIGAIQTSDLGRKPDLLIIMGTSLKVHGLKKLVKEFAKSVHAAAPASSSTSSGAKRLSHKVIFVNKTAPGSEWNDVIDYHVMGDTDTWARRVEADWRRMRPSDWETQQTLFAMSPNGKSLPRVVKNQLTKQGKPKAKGKRPLGEENIAMEPIDLTAPSSPPKRRQGTSHYHQPGSPTKKQALLPRKPSSSSNGHSDTCPRGLLFGERTNQEANHAPFGDDDDVDSGVQFDKLALCDEDDGDEAYVTVEEMDVSFRAIATPKKGSTTTTGKRRPHSLRSPAAQRRTPAKKAATAKRKAGLAKPSALGSQNPLLERPLLQFTLPSSQVVVGSVGGSRLVDEDL